MAEPRIQDPLAAEDAVEEHEILFVAKMRKETHAQLKEQAAVEGVTVKTLLARLFREHTEREEEGAAP